MSLVSLDFVLFLLVVVALNWALLPLKTLYRIFLLAACYLFYGMLGVHFLVILVNFSVWTWLLGLGIGYSRAAWFRKSLVALHVLIGIGGLAFFKYYDLFYESLSRVFLQIGAPPLLPELDVAVPLGISFFTFQGLSYSIDVFRDPGRVVKNPMDALIFVAFFPTLLSGPIMRSADFIPQIGAVRHDNKTACEAFSLILMGLAKKLVLSSYLFEHVVQPVFENPCDFSSLCVAIGALGYSIQILCDFSGYTDLVTGIALLMGYSIPANFNNPYSATNLKDFWHRWHMSLSLWLRDYLYIPLGGKRRGVFRKYLNIFITMTLGGLWHGANWNFLFWGGFHGVGLLGAHLVSDMKGRSSGSRAEGGARRRPGLIIEGLSAAWSGVSWLATFVFVTIGWVFFGTKSFGQATTLLGRIWALDPEGRSFSHYVTLAVVSIIGAVLLHEVFRLRLKNVLSEIFQGLPFAFQVALLGVLVSVLLRLAPDGVPQFIYYQF